MPELPTTPFPELHALDEKRQVPSLGDLLRGTPGLPAPAADAPPAGPSPSVLGLPSFPKQEAEPTAAEPSQPAEPTPEDDQPETLRETLAALMAEDQHSPDPSGASPPDHESTPPDGAVEATDADLVDAVTPILQSALRQAGLSASSSASPDLEPMLRSTVRRALAEQMDSSRQFREIGMLDRLAWRLRALFSSRSYDDVVFDRTRRYQIEEAYLLRRESKTLISYASHDPARHAAARRVQATVRFLASRVQAPDGTIEPTFDLPEHRIALVREGAHCLLVGILRGRSNALVRADLEYILRQAEDRFGARLEQQSDAFLYVLQPILEGALLIQSPAPPR